MKPIYRNANNKLIKYGGKIREINKGVNEQLWNPLNITKENHSQVMEDVRTLSKEKDKIVKIHKSIADKTLLISKHHIENTIMAVKNADNANVNTLNKVVEGFEQVVKNDNSLR